MAAMKAGKEQFVGDAEASTYIARPMR